MKWNCCQIEPHGLNWRKIFIFCQCRCTLLLNYITYEKQNLVKWDCFLTKYIGSLSCAIKMLVTNPGIYWNQLSSFEGLAFVQKLTRVAFINRAIDFVSAGMCMLITQCQRKLPVLRLNKDSFLNDQYKAFFYEVYHWSKQRFHSPGSMKTLSNLLVAILHTPAQIIDVFFCTICPHTISNFFFWQPVRALA